MSNEEGSAPKQVRLEHLLVAAFAYASLLAICSMIERLTLFHVTTSFSIALFILTYRIYVRPPYTQIEVGVIFTHLFGAISHVMALFLILFQKGFFDPQRRFGAWDILLFFVMATCASFSILGVPYLLLNMGPAKRYALCAYGALGAMPIIVELWYMQYRWR